MTFKDNNTVAIQVIKMGRKVGLIENYQRLAVYKNNIYDDFVYWAKIHFLKHTVCNIGRTYPLPLVSAFALLERINIESFISHGKAISAWENDWNVCMNITERAEFPTSIIDQLDLVLDLITGNISSGLCTERNYPHIMSIPRTHSDCSLYKLVICLIIYDSLYTNKAKLMDFHALFIQTKSKRRLLYYLKQSWPCIAMTEDGCLHFRLLPMKGLDALLKGTSADVYNIACSFSTENNVAFVAWYDLLKQKIYCTAVRDSETISMHMEYKDVASKSWHAICINEPEVCRPSLCLESADIIPSKIIEINSKTRNDFKIKVPWQKGWVHTLNSKWERDHSALQVQRPLCFIVSYYPNDIESSRKCLQY